MGADARCDPAAWGATKALEQGRLQNALVFLWNEKRTGITSELRYGDHLQIYEQDGEWRLVAARRDGYLGWAKHVNIAQNEAEEIGLVSARSTHIYPKPDIKTPPVKALSIGSAISCLNKEGEFIKSEEGFLFAEHLMRRELSADEWACSLIGAPYLWGGASAWGIDCSALVQLAFMMCKIDIPRDSDQQEAALPLVDLAARARGDLVFWPGHVGIIGEDDQLIHATAWKMQVIEEPLEIAIWRIGEPSSIRRVVG